MAARPTWSGAITFAGFPIPVKAYNLTKSRSADSFKTLAPNGLPITQVYMDSTGEVVDRATCDKGVEVGKDMYAVIPPEMVDMIASAERSVALDIMALAPPESVPLHLATGAYRLVPDDKVPGSQGPVNILWNGLRATGRVLVTEWTPRGGARDSILAVQADEYGLNANTLPWQEELADVPEWTPAEDAQAASTFEQFIVAQDYNLDDFHHADFQSKYAERRAAAIEAALKGEVIAMPEAAKPTTAAPDLMAMMASALGSTKAPAKKPAATKKVAGR